MNLNTKITKTHRVLVRAFRPIDDPASCLEFLRGHLSVLKRFKIAHITSNTVEWTKHDATIAFTIESLEDGSMLGGGRLQVYDHKYPLPIEQAIGSLDSRIYTKVNQWAENGVAEFCGLWNTLEAIKMGIGSIFIGRIGIAIAAQLQVSHILALTAPATIKGSKKVGFLIEESLGNKGTFYYPKIDLLATLFHLNNVDTLEFADPNERKNIFELRDRLNFKRTEYGQDNVHEVEYYLKINNLKKSNFYHIRKEVK